METMRRLADMLLGTTLDIADMAEVVGLPKDWEPTQVGR